MASKDDITRAFLRFDRLGFHVALQVDLFKTLEEQREAVTAEWHDLFQYVETSVFNAAVPIVMKNSTFWPKPVEMMAAIDEVQRNKVAEKKEADKGPVHYRELDPAVKDMISGVMEKHAFAHDMPIESEVFDVAHSFFPEISERLVRLNYCEFRQLADQNRAMLADNFGQVMQGRCLVPRLDARGFVTLVVSQMGVAGKRGAA